MTARSPLEAARPAYKDHGDCSSLAGMACTPLQRIRLHLARKQRDVFLKLEGANPGGSIKDRTALSLLQSLENTGQLRTGGRLVESSSGFLAKS